MNDRLIETVKEILRELNMTDELGSQLIEVAKWLFWKDVITALIVAVAILIGTCFLIVHLIKAEYGKT